MWTSFGAKKPWQSWLYVVILTGSVSFCFAEDWPEWRGSGRLGVWTDKGVVDRFPAGGLNVKWRVPVAGGFSGPAVSDGRVFVSDYREDRESKTMDGTERLWALDEETGKVLWTDQWPVTYRSLMASYAIGPRATPTVDEDRVYVVGATGVLRCLDVETGKLKWHKDFAADYGTSIPTWGVSSAPLVYGELLIQIVGGEPDAKVVAFNKFTGDEVWRALPADSELGYGQPIVIHAGGVDQLVVWHPTALSSLNPETGEVYWSEPWEVGLGMSVATPVFEPPYLFVTQFYGGSMMLEVSEQRPIAEVLWKRKGKSEMPGQTDALHALITTPVLEGDLVYGVDSYGQLRCLDARTGDRIWETLEMTELSRWAAAFMVRNGDHYLVNNDQGDLILARFSRNGYAEIDRTHLIDPTSNSAWGSRPGRPRPRDRIVNWSHPAYANRHIFARNDKEIIRASLERTAKTQ